MKGPIILTFMALTGLSALSRAQIIVDGPSFFDPDFRAQHAANAGLSLEVDTSVVTDFRETTGLRWDHEAGGYVGLSAILAGAHLRPYTETTGDSLVFGRELTTNGLLANLGPVLSEVLGANALTTWTSTAVLSGITIEANQLYQVSFRVTPGAGIPVDLLSSAEFGITSPGIEDGGGNAFEVLNVLGLITVGSSLEEDVATLTFQSDVARTDLTFRFEATSTVGLGLLGGTAGNMEVLTFSDFTLAPVPEPAVSTMALAFGGIFLIRRRRK